MVQVVAHFPHGVARFFAGTYVSSQVLGKLRSCTLNLIVLGSRFQAGYASSLRMAGLSDCAARRQAPMDMSKSRQKLRITYMKRA
ncbi:hypothetical protein TIA1EST1_06520 [Cutibacterium acnes hdn-1]|nr:hypothetical protein TIA1EST1_06520 [Cutibacterium acnes hdn-1]